MNGARIKTVLVHGLWMHGLAMQAQRSLLAGKGYDVVCYSYPSVRLTLTENADRLARFARTLDASGINWVGHSMGGIVILRMLEREPALAPGRAVLLGAPCCGSQAGSVLARYAWGAQAVGRTVGEWLEAPSVGTLRGREIGVIAGNSGLGLGRFVARGLSVPHDGTVAVVETELAAACDRIVLPVSHTQMLLSREVARQTAAFLREGGFDHAGAGS